MRLTWTRQTLRPRHRFATSQGGVDQKQTLVVSLEHEGLIGRGEAAPSKLYGQTLESSEAAFETAAALLGDDPFAIDEIVSRLIDAIDGQRAALSAIDAALHDWVGRRIGLPVWRLLGLPRPVVRTTFTLGVATPEQTRAKLDEALQAGFDALKVKVGTGHDLETLSLIRERFAGPLLLDANAAWTPDEARRALPALAEFGPALIEQPLRREFERGMPALRGLVPAPFFADESCERPRDVPRLAGLFDGVNIKLTKCGGIREALRAMTLARALGMRVMLGCFVSSSLAIAPALAIASSADWADLDGALLLADDPFEGISCSAARLTASDAPGLGVTPRRRNGA